MPPQSACPSSLAHTSTPPKPSATHRPSPRARCATAESLSCGPGAPRALLHPACLCCDPSAPAAAPQAREIERGTMKGAAREGACRRVKGVRTGVGVRAEVRKHTTKRALRVGTRDLCVVSKPGPMPRLSLSTWWVEVAAGPKEPLKNRSQHL
eukprot:361422-Chlamydomonas_euryale.AAC.5